MNNNDILRRIRYTFDFNDKQMMELFELGNHPATREEVCNWLKSDEDPDQMSCHDKHLASFLNGLIIKKRGKKEGDQPRAEKTLTNNAIMMKLKIALNLKSDDLLEIFDEVDFIISKHELTAFFRKTTHKHYRTCKDQVLRNFLRGIQMISRGDSMAEPESLEEVDSV